MIPVFGALNTIEAHAIKIHLIGNGIETRVAGDYLQGAIGELPATGMVRVFVAEADEAPAKKLIQELYSKVEKDDSWIPSELR